jgi:hypothetical protein
MPAKLLQIPEPLLDDCEEILKLTDAFCAEHLDAEYGQLCRKLTNSQAGAQTPLTPSARGPAVLGRYGALRHRQH